MVDNLNIIHTAKQVEFYDAIVVFLMIGLLLYLEKFLY